MATPKTTRIAIFAIMIMMVVGTIGSFAVMILQTENDANQATRQQEEMARAMAEYEQQLAEQRKNNLPLEGFEADEFEASEVTELRTELLEKGDGPVLRDDSTISAQYFGWQADGTIFDSTRKVDAESEPIEFPLDGVIEGWQKGLSGQRVGSTVRLTIPAEQAYGNNPGVGTPAGPLKFVVIIEELVENE